MVLSRHSVVGIIRLDPHAFEAGLVGSDDSTLDLLLASFAARTSPRSGGSEVVAAPRNRLANRLRWDSPDAVGAPLDADLDQLLRDLQTEFTIASRAAS
jgi:hypothetical protein